VPDVPWHDVGSSAVAAVQRCGSDGRVPGVDEPSAETRRRLRLTSPPLAFIGGLLVLAAILAAVIVVIWAVGN
jgi:hypothetical protein